MARCAQLFWSVLDFAKDDTNRVGKAAYVEQLVRMQKALVPGFDEQAARASGGGGPSALPFF